MIEDGFFRLLSLLEGLGVGLSIAAWCAVAGGVLAMTFALRREKRTTIWVAAATVVCVSLFANLADYLVTLSRSPDLGLEANPIWRGVIDHFGLRVAKWYGLTGKILVSVLAGQMFAFYLSNVERLFPREACSLFGFLRHMGDRSRTQGERLLALFTLFAFFFAGIQLFYLYIAFWNSLESPALLDRLPSVPSAVLMMLALLSIAFATVTYLKYRAVGPDRART